MPTNLRTEIPFAIVMVLVESVMLLLFVGRSLFGYVRIEEKEGVDCGSDHKECETVGQGGKRKIRGGSCFPFFDESCADKGQPALVWASRHYLPISTASKATQLLPIASIPLAAAR